MIGAVGKVELFREKSLYEADHETIAHSEENRIAFPFWNPIVVVDDGGEQRRKVHVNVSLQWVSLCLWTSLEMRGR